MTRTRPAARLAPAALLSLLLAAPAALAEGPAGGPEGGAQEDPREVARRITKAMREAEEALRSVSRANTGSPAGGANPRPAEGTPPDAPRPGEPAAPSGRGGAAEGARSGRRAAEEIRKLLQECSGGGKSAVAGIEELLRMASRSGGGGGGGGGSGDGGGEARSGSDKSEGEGKDPKDGNSKTSEQPKGDPLKDNKPDDKSGGKSGDPDAGDKNKNPADPNARPPRADKEAPSDRDIRGAFLARLPDKVREAVLNGDFDQVPERYRDLVAEWTKRLAEKDAEKAKDEAR